MTFNVAIKVTACDVVDASIGVGRVGLKVAQQISQSPVKVNEMNLSTLFGQLLIIRNLVVLRIAIFVETIDYTAERAIVSFNDDLGTWQTTNPHLTPTGSKTDLAIVARLGVMRFAPLRILPETMPARPDFNPGASLVEPRGNTFAYCQGRNQMSEKRRNEMSAFRRSKSPVHRLAFDHLPPFLFGNLPPVRAPR